MSIPRHWYLVLYDIVQCDKRLRRVHSMLKSWGEPVQYSVFRVRATPREAERLRCELTQVMDSRDRLLMLRMCPSCADRVVVLGEQLTDWDLTIPDVHIV